MNAFQFIRIIAAVLITAIVYSVEKQSPLYDSKKVRWWAMVCVALSPFAGLYYTYMSVKYRAPNPPAFRFHIDGYLIALVALSMFIWYPL